MIKHILIALLLVCLLSGLGNASCGLSLCYYNGDTEGVYTYSATDDYVSITYWGSCENLYVKWYMDVVGNQDCRITRHYNGDCQCTLGSTSTYLLFNGDNEGIYHITGTATSRGLSVLDRDATVGLTNIRIIVSNTSFTEYTVTGNTSCVDSVKLKVYDAGSYKELKRDYTTGSYSFNVLDGYQYQLQFLPSLNQYTFTVNGSNIVYDRDDCSHTQYRFEESCGNLIPDSEGLYIENYGVTVLAIEDFYVPNGILDISDSSADHIYAYTNSFIGSTGWIIDPVVSNSTYTLENPNIAWGLKVIVQNESDGKLIDGAMVKVDQTCYCTSGTSTRQKRTVSGMSQFGEMSLQDASLFVMKTGYKTLNENTTGYSAFLSGRSNFSSKTWIVKLANNSCNNSSEWYEVPNKVDIHFRDVNGNLTSKILDTDAHVDLYYQNNNTEEKAMTMRFESSSTHTYFMPERTYTIPHDTSGYERITNGYFTPWEYSYRAVIYNSSIYGWNITIPLTVRNGTREEEQHYQNLTTNLWFMYASDGKVDYRDDMKVAIHARSNNTTLMTTDIELWKDGVYIACKNLTATDYESADFPYYYVWNPVFDYVTGSNYSVRMYGFDRTLLETDYVVCVSDDTTRKNKLTIGVKDRAGGNLNNCYIYLEDWGSLPTGSTYYNAYEGIDNGDYRYKATKSGYSGGGWESVNLTDEDKIVWYVLSEDYTNTSTTAQKFTDDDIKGFFFPLMFFLLICIVLGGLKYVAS